jgi:hypothetical protein
VERVAVHLVAAGRCCGLHLLDIVHLKHQPAEHLGRSLYEAEGVVDEGQLRIAAGEAIQRARSAPIKCLNSPLMLRFLFGALRAQLDCFASLAMTI